MCQSKRLAISLVSVATIVMLSIACGGGEEGSTEIRFANVYDPSYPHNDCGFPSVSEQVEEETDGSLTVNNFPASQLGDEAELVESVSAQNLEMAITGPSFLSQYDSRVGVLDAAYVFESVDHMEEVVDGEIGQELWDGLLEEADLRVLGNWLYGTRHFTTGDQEVQTPEDLAGVSIRVPDAPVYLANVEALGGSPTPVAFDELYLSLQQGAVDGQEGPIPAVAAEGLNEVQDYLMLMEHVQQSTQVIIAEQTWQSLSSEEQEALEGAINSATAEVRGCIEDLEEESLAEWREAGTPQIIEDVDVDAFRELAQEQLPERFAEEWGDTYERIQAAAE
jgi:tripartite ATP-independent transporter DctP family solute receptor